MRSVILVSSGGGARDARANVSGGRIDESQSVDATIGAEEARRTLKGGVIALGDVQGSNTVRIQRCEDDTELRSDRAGIEVGPG